MGNSLSLGKIFGIPFKLHYTWFIIFVLITVSLTWHFRSQYPFWPEAQYWVVGVATSLLFFASVVAHELAHSIVSRINGIPVKSITLFIFGGVARIAREATRPSTELVMAAAGPLCSLMLGGLFGLVWWLVHPFSEPVGALAAWLFQINMILALFNLIPGFPLDGGRVLRSIIWHFTGNFRRATRIASQTGRGVAYLFILGGILVMFITHDWFGGLWLAFIGWFLDSAARTSYRQTALRDSLQGFTAEEVMITECPTVSPKVTLRQLVQGYVLPTGHRFFLVTDEGRLEGIVTLHNIKAIPEEERDTATVEEAMTPADKLKIAHSGEDALTLLERMDEEDVNQMLVVREGRVIGVVARDNLLRFIQTRSELGE